MESIKAWHVMKKGIEEMVREKYKDVSEEELSEILREVEEECKSETVEEFTGCLINNLDSIVNRVRAKKK